MEDLINRILFRVLVFYLSETAVLFCTIGVCIWYVCHNYGKKADKLGVLTVALVIYLVFFLCSSVFPFLSDYATHNIISVHGEYTNTNSDAATDLLGIYGIKIVCAQDEIHLTTAPLHSKEDFPKGTFDVTAYYTGNSGLLLYIEPNDEVA